MERKTATEAANDTNYEFCSQGSGQIYSDLWFGMNVYDIYSQEQLAAMARDPMGNNKILRDLSRVLYGTSGIYTNTVDYMTAMPTLDRVIVAHGSDQGRKKINASTMEETLRLIKDKEIVRDALWRGMIDGAAYYYFEVAAKPVDNSKYLNDFDVRATSEINEIRTIPVNVSVISLPCDWTEIVGIKNNSYVIAFNLDYFAEGNAEPVERKLRKFPKEIRDAYWERRGNGGNGKVKGNWVVLDNTKTIVHKIRSQRSEKYGRPLVLAAITDILYNDYFTSTKRKSLDELNNRVIYQTLPEGKDKGICALTKKQQEEQHEVVKRAIMNKNSRGGTSFFTVSAGTKLDALKVCDTDIFDEKNESGVGDKIATDLGIASSLLNGSSSGTYSAQENNLELITAQLFQWIEQIQEEINKCVNSAVIKDKNNRVECKYLPITFVNKGKMVGFAKDLYLQGKGSLSLWASACGISPDVFFALLDKEKEEGIEKKYPVHQTSFTMTSDEKGGRPVTDEPTDNTVRSRANNGNAAASPSDN